ncbi:MAG: DUF1826 domain-containing protein [Gammaproteobacteria bacterium]|nr:DUF1826 domain-containing protein [Gammaproteobacteria bacterium]
MSDRTGDFAAICDEDIELVSVARPPSGSLDALAERLFASRHNVQTQWEQAARDADAPLAALSMSIDADGLGAHGEEITLAGDMLNRLVGCERIGIRVTTLRRPMCPRFHVDNIPCRMLVTIRESGTEWIANGDVDQALLAARDTDAPPVRRGGDIRQLPTRNSSLLKGGAWNHRFGGVVHRSPHGVGERLLLSFDPLYGPARRDGPLQIVDSPSLLD